MRGEEQPIQLAVQTSAEIELEKRGSFVLFLLKGILFSSIALALVGGFLIWSQLYYIQANSLETESYSADGKNLYFSQLDPLPYRALPKPQEAQPSKMIVIDISEQMFYCYEDGQLVKKFVTSTGKPSTPTKIGRFKVLDKYPMAYGGVKGERWAMPYWLGIYYAGSVENGIHALPYINGVKESARSLGRRVSHGCIRLADQDAIWVYNWAEIGTPVIVQW